MKAKLGDLRRLCHGKRQHPSAEAAANPLYGVLSASANLMMK